MGQNLVTNEFQPDFGRFEVNMTCSIAFKPLKFMINVKIGNGGQLLLEILTKSLLTQF